MFLQINLVLKYIEIKNVFVLKLLLSIICLQTGSVDLHAFDKMIEMAAATPRKFGLAPKTSEIFATEAVS